MNYIARREIRIVVRAEAPSAKHYDAYMRELKHQLRKVANEGARQQRHGVQLIERVELW